MTIREGLLLLGLLWVPAVLAQAPADTAGLYPFFPLHAGNEWTYRKSLSSNPVGYDRYTVAGDTLVHDTLYVQVWRSEYDRDLDRTAERRFLLRYDSASVVVSRVGEQEVGWELAPAVQSRFSERWPAGSPWDTTTVARDTTVAIGGAGYAVERVRTTEQYGDYSQVDIRRHGWNVGLLYLDRCTALLCAGNQMQYELVHAAVDGRTYGQRVVATLLDPPGELPAARASLTVFPNPAAGAFVVAFTLPEPQACTLALYDLLGHRVRQLGALPAGGTRGEVHATVSGVAAGTYVVRLEGAKGASAAQGITLLP